MSHNEKKYLDKLFDYRLKAANRSLTDVKHRAPDAYVIVSRHIINMKATIITVLNSEAV